MWAEIQEPNDSGIITYLNGVVIGKDGRGRFYGYIPVGKVPEADGNVILQRGDGEFDTPRESFIRLFLRSHGEVIPERIDEQRRNYEGGCELRTCQNLLESIHEPATSASPLIPESQQK